MTENSAIEPESQSDEPDLAHADVGIACALSRELAFFFDNYDSGDENDPNPEAYRLPSGDYDVPMILADKQFGPAPNHENSRIRIPSNSAVMRSPPTLRERPAPLARRPTRRAPPSCVRPALARPVGSATVAH